MTTTSITSGQQKQFVRFVEDAAEKALAEAGVDKDGLQRLLERGGEFQSGLVALIAKYAARGPIIPTYEELRKEFDWVSDGFKPGAATDWQLDDSCKDVAPADPAACELVHFSGDMSTQAVLEALKSRGLRPATLDELLAYARKNPNAQKEFPIVALGASCAWNDDRSVPCLSWSGDERLLLLRWRGRGWYGYYRFLAVRA